MVAIETEYPKGTLLPWHQHRRAQFLYGGTGVMHVFTKTGNWIVPPQRAVWIPPRQEHKVKMIGVTTRSIYIEPVHSPVDHKACQVRQVSPLLRELLLEAVDIPDFYDETGRDGALVELLFKEIAQAPVLPFHIPLPGDCRLSERCQRFLDFPDIHDEAKKWADSMYVSHRTFSRLFRAETGMSFHEWKQQACVVLALTMLSDGIPVTSIASEFGYQGASAFSTMFKRVLGQPPSDFLPQARVISQRYLLGADY
jgi:AraC-like DNA-binding protein